jgi:predicted permease
MSEPKRERRFFRPNVAQDVEDEIVSHLEMRRTELTEAGLDPEAAAEAAARRFGTVAAVARECREIDSRWYRETRRTRMWRDFRQDLGYGLRLLARAPGFTTLAVLTLALGIGATTAIFSVVDAALLRPLPYPHPEQLVSVSVKEKAADGDVMQFGPSVADIEAWRNDGQVFSHITIWRRVMAPGILDGPGPERISMRRISEDYLRLHGVAPVAGRDFDVADTKAGAPAVALISYGFWQARFGGAPDVLDRVIRVDGEPMTIVGVLPSQFYPDEEVWRPYPATGSLTRRGSGASIYGRLRPGVTIEQAEARLAQVAAATAGQDPAEGVVVESLLEDAIADYAATTNVLVAAVGAILLIACINVAGLLLARGAVRSSELAIRTAIGAGRMRLLRQLLTESVVLALIGGAAGVCIAWLTLDLLVANIPIDLPANSPVTLNPRVLALAAGLSMATGLLFGFLPALRFSRANVAGVLARGDRRHGSALSRRGGQILIACEVALALVLLSGAGLMIRSFNRLLAVDLGFDPARVLTIDVVPVSTDAATLRRYYPALVESLRHMPGIEAVGAVDHFPMGGGSTITFARSDGEWINVHLRGIVGQYLEALEIPMLAGRAPTAEELAGAAPVVVLNEQAVRELFGGGSPIGRHFSLRDTAHRVVGVIRDVRSSGPRFPPEPEVYLGYGIEDPRPAMVVVRPRPDSGPLQAQLREAARAIGPRVVISHIRPASELSSLYVLTPRQRDCAARRSRGPRSAPGAGRRAGDDRLRGGAPYAGDRCAPRLRREPTAGRAHHAARFAPAGRARHCGRAGCRGPLDEDHCQLSFRNAAHRTRHTGRRRGDARGYRRCRGLDPRAPRRAGGSRRGAAG